ncbi:interferon-induced protein 44-like isoform X2 [Solea solea]|uniref:interferon-induced protein 44-like isoform X2 n=1 Tax=Solea solea TaxID=90069 RepID=UPI00272C00D8|nr:interferon-induced protein 44-like isoform X2 [Solea solea]
MSFGGFAFASKRLTDVSAAFTPPVVKDAPETSTLGFPLGSKVNDQVKKQVISTKASGNLGSGEEMDVSTKQMTNGSFSFGTPSLESPWRDVEWTEARRSSLMKTVSSHRPSCNEVTETRVLLLGPVGSGKSSFISSVQSVFNGRVTNRAMVGSSPNSFTKKSFNIRGQKGEDAPRLVLCDIMGLSEQEMTGLTLHDILSVIKGHVPEGHKFSPDQPVRPETEGYVKWPGLKDKIHCVAFVVDASKILKYPKGTSTIFQQLREHISDLGVHQVALLTHIDQLSLDTAKDITHVYRSSIIRDMMSKAGELLGMSTSYIVPVKNYASELDVDVNMDVLLLSAVDHIMQYADLYFQDHTGKVEKDTFEDMA